MFINIFFEGNLRRSWTSTTNGVFYQSGAKSVKQLQVKKVCLLKKMTEPVAERHRMTNSVPWKRNFDSPQVPPPSRSPSKTNIIWVRVRNSSGKMEIDGFLRTNKDFEELLPEDKDNIVPTKIEVRVPYEQDKPYEDCSRSTLGIKIDDLNLNTDSVFGKPYEKNYSVLENLETDFRESMVGQKSLLVDHDAKQASARHTEELVDQLAPTVKGLKVVPNEIRRSTHVKQKSEERPKTVVYEKCSRIRNDRIDNENSYVFQDKVKTTAPCPKSESDVKSSRADSGGDRRNIVGSSTDIVSGLPDVEDGPEKVRRDGKKIKRFRKKIGSVWKSDQSNTASGRKGSGKVDRKKIGNDRTKIEKNRNKRNTTSSGKNAKESKTKRHGRSSRELGKSSSMEISEGETVQKFVKTKPNVQEIRVLAKKFTMTTKSEGKTGKKKQENKEGLPAKPRSTTRLYNKKSDTNLPRKSCSACTVKTSAKDANIAEIRSKSVTSTCSKMQNAVTLQDWRNGVFSLEKKSQLPMPITLPSQTQLQNFDKVAKIKLRQTLAVKMRKQCYTGSWAFLPARENRMEEKE